MGDLNLIQVCDHTVTTVTVQIGDVPVVRGSGTFDVIPVSGLPRVVLKVTDSSNNVLSPDIYNLYGSHLVWISNNSTSGQYRNPAPGEGYIVTLQYSQTSSQSYSPALCPKCGGQNWYVDVITPLSGMTVVTGVHQVLQEYLKCLLTQRGTDILNPTYGTTLLDSMGQDINNPKIQSSIVGAVKEAESQVKQYQATDINRSLDATLDNVTLNSLLADDDGPGFFISITVTTLLGKQATVNLAV